MAEYELRVANDPNADGLYVAEIRKGGSYITTRVHEDRAEAIRRAEQWVRDDRNITYETIEVPFDDPRDLT